MNGNGHANGTSGGNGMRRMAPQDGATATLPPQDNGLPAAG